MNTADETDSGAAAARDTECGAEEGISTSGERGERVKPMPRGAEEGISTSGESGKHRENTRREESKYLECENRQLGLSAIATYIFKPPTEKFKIGR